MLQLTRLVSMSYPNAVQTHGRDRTVSRLGDDGTATGWRLRLSYGGQVRAVSCYAEQCAGGASTGADATDGTGRYGAKTDPVASQVGRAAQPSANPSQGAAAACRLAPVVL